MARVLDKNKPYVEVFGAVDENEKDKTGKPHVPHRYRQFGMTFDDAGELIGEELPVPPDDEDEAAMRVRIEKEIRAKLEIEFREKRADAAKTGGVTKEDKGDDDLPGALGTRGRRT